MTYNPISHDFKTFKKILLSDKSSKKEYDQLEAEFLLIAEMIRARKNAKKTQKEIAAMMKTSSSVISRLESIDAFKHHSPTLETLKKYAKAVGCRVSIKFVPEENQRKQP